MFKKIAVILILPMMVLSFLNLETNAQNVPVFDPNYIMSDNTFKSTRAFNSPDDIQRYLDTKSGPLGNYREGSKRASDIIYDAARGITSQKFGITPRLNPGVLLAYLEKEMSLLSIANYDPYVDPQNRMVIAMGYGCPDTAKCDSEYYGFSNQLNWAAFQLQYNFEKSEQNSPNVYPYVKNNRLITLDEYNVVPVNSATASNYRYTPHVYWGNYNLWKIVTANGWGESSAQYSYSQIDAVNLPFKDAQINTLANPYRFISNSEGLDLVKDTYSFGQLDSSVEALQAFLRQEGYYNIREINGRYGTKTPSAHKQYRIDKKIIDWIFTSVSQAECERLITTNFSIGTENGDVYNLQRCLTDIGIFDSNLQTSYYGPITDGSRSAALAYFNDIGRGATTQDEFVQPEGPSIVVGTVNLEDKLLNISLNKGFANENLDAVDCNWLQYQTYSLGVTSQQVYNLQRCLAKWGKMPASLTTAYYGPITQAARVTDYDERYGYMCSQLLKEEDGLGEQSETILELQKCMNESGIYSDDLLTGYFGSYTLEKSTLAKDIANSSCWNNLFAASYGEVSQRVKGIQECLIEFGFLETGNNTSYYGPLTQAALNQADTFRSLFKSY